ncbi:related to UDP-N-ACETYLGLUCOSAMINE--PEPTIDE N-ACETYLGLUCOSAMINYLTRANSFERASE [Rhynchosporium graminicola]|uniref:protein O-GlcNAc transferase n=1 Tax=Rhynchosporium graminicola TaxID=2792576 RepID=A0A1E1K666_9HELO|nr:related to UDP-N-ACETYLGLUCOSAMINE--PEPTIDE N-ACETYLGLUCOSAMINYLTRANSFERASE [Rhynchosporium commune]
MIPQVAHHPRPVSQQFGTQGFAIPPFDPLQQPRRLDRPAPLPFRSARNDGSSLAPPHRAYPIENDEAALRSRAAHGGFASVSLGGQYVQQHQSEHMLRRKTPSGTLAAGYDGTPVQWSGRAPAFKHVVLPVSESSSNNTGMYSMSGVGHANTRWISSSLGNNYQQVNHMTRLTGDGHDLQLNSGVPPWAQAQFPTLSSQNVWDYIQTQRPPGLYPNNGMQIPTVLQPAYQPSPGPTASDDAGLYGPYWPDGRFVPYRPAAVRDDGGNSNNVPSMCQGSGHQFLPSAGLLPPFQQLSFTDDMNMVGRNHHATTSTRSGSVAFQEKFYNFRTSTHTSNGHATTLYPVHDDCRTPTAQSPSSASNPRIKEKTLSWAHGIYVDLLASLHQTKKESRKSRHGQGFRTYSKSSIYPKPPRQPASVLGSTNWSDTDASESNSSGHSNNPMSAQTFSQNPSATSSNAWHRRGELNDLNNIRPPNQDMPHYMSPFQTYPQAPISPSSKAREALDTLATLCAESGWQWIDGMLLGGCLAYGLEEYKKALDWYTKIIALDSMWVEPHTNFPDAGLTTAARHVEAISNLAATLLCLNRREEAEQYWLRSVKLRPSYFEAVEHLIGLLCGDHRGTEAVNIIEFVERSLRLPRPEETFDYFSETSSNADRESCGSNGTLAETIAFDFDLGKKTFSSPQIPESDDLSTYPGFGSSGFSIPGSDSGRMLALVHAKGNMLYALGDINGASKAFEEAVLISTGGCFRGIQDLIKRIVNVLSIDGLHPLRPVIKPPTTSISSSPLLLPPDRALQTARLVFTKNGELPGLCHVPGGLARRAAVSTTSNSLLSLAKIFQDAMSNSSSRQRISRMPNGVGDILALYYLSLSLQPSPSTANNVGILLASVQQPPSSRSLESRDSPAQPAIPGVVPGSGVALALAYYNYGLNLDSRHAHIYTNLGSLLKDIGQLAAAITMYEKAVACDGSFDIALANLANAVKDQGRISDAIGYYRRAVASSPDFAEAVCGLANALNSVCNWAGRGGVILDGGRQDRWHVDETGMFRDARSTGQGSGWMKRVVEIVAKQLKDGSTWGRGILMDQAHQTFLQQLETADSEERWPAEKMKSMQETTGSWAGQRWEGSRVIRMIERATKRAMHRWYYDRHVLKRHLPPSQYPRPRVPGSLTVPTAPTVLPFHTFTCPLSAKDIRMISQRNALRISCSTLKASWMQGCVFPPPPPPAPYLNVGYVSSDFNNHPLAHLMQSVFGLHDPSRTKAFCYATTASDNSVHRQQIEREAPVFRDSSGWSADRLVHQIIQDEIHILVNLNGYTRGARNEVFAARPAPIQMSFMGFAGTLGAEWCDYILADETAIPHDTLRPWRRNIDLEDQLLDQQSLEEEGWVYSENIIFCRDTFFCCDHAQSEPRERSLSWDEEQSRRWKMRKELFPSLSDDAIILGNFNQLYKIEPTTFRTWLRILDRVPKAILWLLRFPDLGESNLKRTAQDWAGENVASRIWFTDVAPKHQHISRARVCDLFLDTPECNAHTTAADVLWSSTPLLTLPRYKYKMCSRMAASILKGALPRSEEGRQAAADLIAEDDIQYEELAIQLASGLSYNINSSGYGDGIGRLGELRKLLYDSRWTCALFDTKRWVSDLETAYEEAWRRWVANEGGDIYL